MSSYFIFSREYIIYESHYELSINYLFTPLGSGYSLVELQQLGASTYVYANRHHIFLLTAKSGIQGSKNN